MKKMIVGVFTVLLALLIVGCSKASPDDTSQDQYVPVQVELVVYHSGYKGTIVSPGICKPTEGKIVSLEFNGKKVEVANQGIVDGFIETKDFGKIGIRFGSMVATVGAGDFTSVREGSVAPEPAIEVYVQKSKEKQFVETFAK